MAFSPLLASTELEFPGWRRNPTVRIFVIKRVRTGFIEKTA